MTFIELHVSCVFVLASSHFPRVFLAFLTVNWLACSPLVDILTPGSMLCREADRAEGRGVSICGLTVLAARRWLACPAREGVLASDISKHSRWSSFKSNVV